jgi:serine/threonine protein kinase
MSFRFDKNSSRYKIKNKLGEGSYGTVYRAIDRITNAAVALKINKISSDEEGIPASTLREICFLRTLKHENIIKLQDVILNTSQIILVFDYMKSDLRTYIASNPIGEETIKKMLVQLLKAVHYCHSARVMHRDLKPQNILLDFATNLKIADFGLARNYQVPLKPYTQSVQTLWYRAPELLLGCKVYNTSIDMWSIGCIFSEMLTGYPLFQGVSEKDTIFSIFKFLGTPDLALWPELSDFKFPTWSKVTMGHVYPQLPTEGLDLLEKLLQINPAARISAAEALNHVIYIQSYLKPYV